MKIMLQDDIVTIFDRRSVNPDRIRFYYIPLAEINGTPYFFDYFSILQPFDLRFIP
jgi:hypothetical protein